MNRAARWTVEPASRFAAFADEWTALDDAGFRSPALHADFVAPALAHFGTGAERIALLRGPDGLEAAGVFAKSGTVVFDSFQPSQAPLGFWLQRDGARGLPDDATLRGLAAGLGSTALIVGLSQLDPEHVARVGRSDVHASDYIDTARVTIDGTFDAYWAARGKNLRSNVKKQHNKLDAEGIVLRVDCVTEPADVAACVRDYGRLESASWKAAGGTAVSADNAQGRFYRDLLEAFCARGAGHVYRCFYNDRLAAMDLCISHAGTMIILKTSFDESIKGTSPAHLMRHAYLPAIFANRTFARVEFYGRVMEWHTKWSQEIRTLYHATAYRRPWVAKLDAMRRARAAAPAAATDAAAEAASAESAS